MDCREKILSEDYFSLILDYPVLADYLEERGIDYCYVPVRDNLGVFYLNRQMLPEFFQANYSYRNIPQLYGLEAFPDRGSTAFDPQPLEKSGILSLQRQPLSLTGLGVIVGIIDTGISYENPVFRYSDGSSRILAAWDQTDQSGTPPEGFFYGTEYTQAQINAALESPNPAAEVPLTDGLGHGSALAAAAAGSRLEGGSAYTGAAPDALFVVVKVKPAKEYLRELYLTAEGEPAFSTDDLMLALHYLEGFTRPFQRPQVMLMGMGTSLGSHNGGSIFADYLQTVALGFSQAVVVGGGNEGNAAGHFRAQLTEEPVLAEIRVEENTKGFLAELWGMRPATFRIGVRSPGGEVAPEVDLRLGSSIDYTFVYEKTRLELYYIPYEGNTGDQLALMRFRAPSPGIWTLTVRAVRNVPDSFFDLWLSPSRFIQGEAYFLRPTPETTLTMPAYVEDAVTVTAYNSANDSFYYNSGQGFSRTGAKKPDMAAPGVRVSTPAGPYTGASMAAALTAGATAQLLQWAVVEENRINTNGREIRQILASGAREERAEEYPSRQWGYGRLDLQKTFDEIAGRGLV